MNESDSEFDIQESSYISQKLSLLRDWQFEIEVIAPLPSLKWFPCSVVTLVLFYLSILILEQEQEAGLSIKLWASVGRSLVCVLYLLYIICKARTSNVPFAIEAIIIMPLTKEFKAIFFTGFSNALAGIFFMIAIDFANRAEINHGIMLSLSLVASVLVFLLAYRWDNELPTFIQFCCWIAMIVGVVILTIRRPIDDDDELLKVDIDLCKLAFLKDFTDEDMIFAYIFGSLSALCYFANAAGYKYLSTKEFGTNSVLNAVFAMLIEAIILLLINLICNPVQYSIGKIILICASGIASGLGTILYSVSIATGVAGISYTVANSVSILQTVQDYIMFQTKPDLMAVTAFGLLVLSGMMVLYCGKQQNKSLSIEDQLREDINREMTELCRGVTKKYNRK